MLINRAGATAGLPDFLSFSLSLSLQEVLKGKNYC